MRNFNLDVLVKKKNEKKNCQLRYKTLNNMRYCLFFEIIQ